MKTVHFASLNKTGTSPNSKVKIRKRDIPMMNSIDVTSNNI
jgi:hypothetical protein